MIHSYERGTLRSSHRKLDRHRQPQYCSVRPHGDIAGRWQGARRRWRELRPSRERGTLRSSHGKLDRHRQPQYCSVFSHGDVALQWQGAGRRLVGLTAPSRARNSTIQHGKLDFHRQPQYCPRSPHGDVAPRWQGARRRWAIPNGELASAELYDPATGTWTVTGSLNTGSVLVTRRHCSPMARCSSQAAGERRSGERRTLRSSHGKLDLHRQPQYCPRRPHGDFAC